jgi:hypothetical protein
MLWLVLTSAFDPLRHFVLHGNCVVGWNGQTYGRSLSLLIVNIQRRSPSQAFDFWQDQIRRSFIGLCKGVVGRFSKDDLPV